MNTQPTPAMTEQERQEPAETTDAEQQKPTGCTCVTSMNRALAETCPGVKLLIDLMTNRPVIAVVRVSGKGKTPTLFPSFCPFCGVQYGV